MNEYVFRWYCSACNEGGEWTEDLEEATEDREYHKQITHEERYDGPVLENPRIQRYPKEDAPGYEE